MRNNKPIPISVSGELIFKVFSMNFWMPAVKSTRPDVAATPVRIWLFLIWAIPGALSIMPMSFLAVSSVMVFWLLLISSSILTLSEILSFIGEPVF